MFCVRFNSVNETMRSTDWHFTTFSRMETQNKKFQFITNAIQSNFVKLSFAQCFYINLEEVSTLYSLGFLFESSPNKFLLSFDSPTKKKQKRNQSRFRTVMKVIEWNIKQQETWTLFRLFQHFSRVSILIDTKGSKTKMRKSRISRNYS